MVVKAAEQLCGNALEQERALSILESIEREESLQAWQLERDRLQTMLEVEKQRLGVRRKAFEQERQTVENKSKELAKTRNHALAQLELEHKKVQDLVKKFSQAMVTQQRFSTPSEEAENQKRKLLEQEDKQVKEWVQKSLEVGKTPVEERVISDSQESRTLPSVPSVLSALSEDLRENKITLEADPIGLLKSLDNKKEAVDAVDIKISEQQQAWQEMKRAEYIRKSNERRSSKSADAGRQAKEDLHSFVVEHRKRFQEDAASIKGSSSRPSSRELRMRSRSPLAKPMPLTTMLTLDTDRSSLISDSDVVPIRMPPPRGLFQNVDQISSSRSSLNSAMRTTSVHSSSSRGHPVDDSLPERTHERGVLLDWSEPLRSIPGTSSSSTCALVETNKKQGEQVVLMWNQSANRNRIASRSPPSPLSLTRGLARQLLGELRDAINQDNPELVLESFGLGKGPEAWSQVECAMRPHLDQDPLLKQEWMDVVWA